MDLDANPKRYTVIFTVKLTGASIGAGFRAIPPKVTSRNLSRSIGLDNGCQLQRRASVTVPEAPQKRVTSNALSHCPKTLFRMFFYRHGTAQAVRSTVPIEISRLACSRRTFWRDRIPLRRQDWPWAAPPDPPCPDKPFLGGGADLRVRTCPGSGAAAIP